MSSGGGSGGSSNQTQQVILPEWIQEAGKANIATANEIANRPYEANPSAYTVAPLTADQQAAYSSIRDMQGGTAPAYQSAEAAAAGLLDSAKPITTGQLTTDTQALLNPYSDIVIDPTLQLMRQQLDQSIGQQRANASNVGAFGGSRLGVQEGVAQSQESLLAGQLKGNLLTSEWDKAMTTASDMAGRNLQAGQWATTTLPQLASAGATQTAKEAAMLEGVGRAEQGQSQAEIDALASAWQDARDYPLQGLAVREQALTATPYGNTTVSTGQTQQQGSKNRVAGALGGAASGASIGSAFGPWGTAIGAIAGGLLGSF